MGKSVHVKQLKPEGPKLVESHSKCSEMFKKVVWDRFFYKFQGYNYEVSRNFAKSFDGNLVYVGGL